MTIGKRIKASYFRMEFLILLSKIVILEIFVQKNPTKKPKQKNQNQTKIILFRSQ